MNAGHEKELVTAREKAQVKLYQAKIELHRARLEAETLNVKLAEAGLQLHTAPCW